MEEGELYKYMPIKSAIAFVNKKVDIYGVVIGYEKPKPTKRSDMISTMTITDMSYHSPGLRLLVFASDSEKLPRVKTIGDIIRLHRVKIEVHKDGFNAVANIRYSSFLLFEGKGATSYIPYHSSHDKFTATSHDETIINSLRSWSENFPIDSGKNDYTVPIKDIREGVYFDLCCKVLFVHGISKSVSIIYVWDGTDAPPKEFVMKPDEEMDIHADQLEESLIASLPRNILCKFPCVGTVLRVFTEMQIDEILRQLPGIEHWVKLRNMTCRTQSGIWEGVMTHTSKVSILSCQTEERYERESTERLESESTRLPQWCPKLRECITVTDCEGVRFSTLMDIITHSQVTYKFRCLVRVIAALPGKVEEFAGQRLNAENHAEYFYRVRLTLEDPTAQIHAYLYAEDADKFFAGHPAADLRSSGSSLNVLKSKVSKLLGIAECTSEEGEKRRICNPPWIKCCVKSYYIDKKSPWESRRYRIFGTTLKG